MNEQSSVEEQKRLRDLRTTSLWLFLVAMFGAALIICRFIVASIPVLHEANRWALQGKTFTSLLWAAGWFAAAFVFGFLFGIPKVLQGTSKPASDREQNSTSQSAENTTPFPSETPYQLRVNTNLEEISDWLTKILVGATLTQLTKVPGLVRAAAGYMATGMSDPGYESFACAVLLYFASIGFFSGYVLTRIFFSPAFGRADQTPNFPSMSLLQDTSIRLGYYQDRPEELRRVVRELGTFRISESLTAPQAVLLAKAANIAGDSDRALQAARLALVKTPKSAEAHLNLAIALHNAGRDDTEVMQELQVARALIAKGIDPLTKEDIYNSLVYLALYLQPPKSFEKAIEYGEELIRQVSPRDASIWINLACAYAQEYGYLRAQGETGEQLNATRQRVLECIQRALKLDPSAIGRLRDLYHGSGPDPKDNDLQVFESDAEFKRLLDGN